ncbi:hypothetical protein EVA_04377 [gut metagenome]|uniref:Uncharacterized protein n=1 Tax=gut metagenome TaxID=749906 RepID=J9H210_9ZZZZ
MIGTFKNTAIWFISPKSGWIRNIPEQATINSPTATGRAVFFIGLAAFK